MLSDFLRVIKFFNFHRQFQVFSSLLALSAILDIVIITSCAPLILAMLNGKNIIELPFELNHLYILEQNLIYFVTSMLVIKIFFQVAIFKHIYKNTFSLYYNIVERVLDKIHTGDRNSTASDLSVSVTSELEEFVKTVILPSFQIISESLLIFLVIIYLIFINVYITLTVICLSFLFFLIFRYRLSSKLSELGNITRHSRLRLIEASHFVALHKTDIKSLGVESFFKKRVLEIMHNFSRTSASYQFYLSLPRLIIELVGLLGLVLLAGVAGSLKLEPTQLTIFGIAILRLLPAVQRIYVSFTQVRFGSRTIGFLKHIISDSVEDVPNSLPVKFNMVGIGEAGKNIFVKYFQDGTLKYCEFSNGINLIVGASGSGKTTFLNSMQLYVGPHQSYTSAKMQQDATLFNGSLYDNIVLGREYDEVRLQSLLKVFFSTDSSRFSLSNLKNIIVSDNGAGLSGGQIQRICLIRTFLVRKRIYFIDEGFANINKELRIQLFSEIHNFCLREDAYAIVVTHGYEPDSQYNVLEI